MFESAIAQFRPRQRCRTLDWARDNVQTNEGRPYDHSAYPHTGAPGGPFDAFDCPQYLTISCQFGSQIAKTFGGLCCLMKMADTDPAPMMFVSSDQKLAVEEVTTKLYPMLNRCKPLRDQLRPPARQKQDLVELGGCRIFVGWSRSVSTLASKAIRVGHANEIDKWEHQSTSKEADPLKLFTDRFKSFPSHKIIFESTPALKSTSRIERLRLAGFNALFNVPCTKCGRYQTLRMGNGSEPGGIVWEKNIAGKSEKELTRKTARYVCLHCKSELGDDHRGPMMRAGVWIPEGCGCDDEKARDAAEAWREHGHPSWRGWSESPWITGEPIRDGRDASYQLSSLYSLQIGWGRYAAEFIDSKGNPENLRNFVNQWEGETWSRIKQATTWEELGNKLIDESLPRFAVPNWASLITLGVDAQEDSTRLPWVLVAWGPGRMHAVIAYGELEDRDVGGVRVPALDAIEQELWNKTYTYADGGGSLRMKIGLIDSGNRPAGVYDFCAGRIKRGVNLWPCKGSSTALDSDYTIATLGRDTSMPGMKYIRVDTIRSQGWMERVLHTYEHGSPFAGSLHADQLAIHQDFLEQVLNDVAVTEADRSNNDRERWERQHKHIPNDFRDAWRYAYVAMLVETRGAAITTRQLVDTAVPAKRSHVVSPGSRRPDGRAWV